MCVFELISQQKSDAILRLTNRQFNPSATNMSCILSRDSLSVIFDFLERPTLEQAIDGQVARMIEAGVKQDVTFKMENGDQS